MRILITGGAGYLGVPMTELFLQYGHYVTVLDNFRHGVQSLNHLCSTSHFTLIRGDARDAQLLMPLLNETDVVIPLAALVGVAECDKDKWAARSTNYEAIQTICDPELKAKFRIIYPNTNSGYGTSGEEICTEESKLRPISLYGRLKCNAEVEVRDRGNSTVFRLATVFGMSSRMRWDLMVNDFVMRAVRDRAIMLFEPKARRNYVHVRDVARAFLWAVEHEKESNNHVFNLGHDESNCTKQDLVVRITTHTPVWSKVAQLAEDPDKRDYFVSSKKLADAGFRALYTLDEGIEELIKGAKQYL